MMINNKIHKKARRSVKDVREPQREHWEVGPCSQAVERNSRKLDKMRKALKTSLRDGRKADVEGEPVEILSSVRFHAWITQKVPWEDGSSACFTLESVHRAGCPLGLSHMGLEEQLGSRLYHWTPARGRESGTAGPGELQGQLGEVSGGGDLDAFRWLASSQSRWGPSQQSIERWASRLSFMAPNSLSLKPSTIFHWAAT